VHGHAFAEDAATVPLSRAQDEGQARKRRRLRGKAPVPIRDQAPDPSGIQPELWVEEAGSAVAFYEAAFDAVVVHRVGEGDDIVAQLVVGAAAFWVASADASIKRFSPRAIGGTTSRTLLVVDDPGAVVAQAAGAGATVTAQVGDEHGWRLGRIIDPFGHEWEIGTPLGEWPPP
jgi:PhnB protein